MKQDQRDVGTFGQWPRFRLEDRGAPERDRKQNSDRYRQRYGSTDRESTYRISCMFVDGTVRCNDHCRPEHGMGLRDVRTAIPGMRGTVSWMPPCGSN